MNFKNWLCSDFVLFVSGIHYLYIDEQKVYYLYIHVNGRVQTVNARDNDPGETFRRVPKGGKEVYGADGG